MGMGPPAIGLPTFQNSWSAQKLFKLPIIVDAGMLPGNVRYAEISNLSCRPLGSAIYAAIHENAGTDTFADGNEHKILFSLRRPPIIFALGRKVGIIFYGYIAFKLSGEHGSESYIAPIL